MILLKSKLSGYYFRDFGTWVAEPEKARVFDNEWAARAFAQQEHVSDVAVSEFYDAREQALLAA